MLDEITTFWFGVALKILGAFASFVLGIVAATLSVAKLIRGFEKKQIETDNEVLGLKRSIADMHIKCAENRDAMRDTITHAVREGMSGMENRWGIELAGANAQRTKQETILENVQKLIEKQADAIIRVHERIDDIALDGRKEPRENANN